MNHIMCSPHPFPPPLPPTLPPNPFPSPRNKITWQQGAARTTPARWSRKCSIPSRCTPGGGSGRTGKACPQWKSSDIHVTGPDKRRTRGRRWRSRGWCVKRVGRVASRACPGAGESHQAPTPPIGLPTSTPTALPFAPLPHEQSPRPGHQDTSRPHPRILP